MCSRYILLEKHYRAMLQRLGIAAPPPFVSRYNIAPNTPIPAVRSDPDTGTPSVDFLRWGLVPAWSKTSDGPPLINARADSVATKPSFRDAVRSRRCVVPATGFYEWHTVGRTKKPWLFQRKDEEPFGLAGLWETWRAPDNTSLETCAFITTEPNEVMRPIHIRMPVMLSFEQCQRWLAEGPIPADELASLLAPPPAEIVSATAVSQHMSNVRNDDPGCIAPAEVDEQGPQLSLGL
jgi:putative SOS response-associated peptidase YedK